MLYYYGNDHLNISLMAYIKDKIKHKQKIYFFMENENYDSLMEFLKVNNVDISGERFDATHILELDELEDIRCAVTELERRAIEQGHTGVCFIGQSTFAIRKTSKESFLAFEANLNKLLERSISSFLCIYDFEDYLQTRTYIDCKVMEESQCIHGSLYNVS